MRFRLVTMPKFVTWWYPKRIWAFPPSENKVFLTFDDGPIPEVTPWVLKTLEAYDAKATFFCIGENIQKHPELFQQLTAQGHAVGNHTFHHLKGSKTPLKQYLANVELSQEHLHKYTPQGLQKRKLFRPPYGKMTRQQAQALLASDFQIIMWNVLSYDWDSNLSPEKCFQNVKSYLLPGSIVVFHDSLKAEKNLRYTLPKVLDFIQENGWKAVAISE